MKNYKIQNSCHNCGHCFILTEYDANDEFYCTKNAPPRPISGSCHLNEQFNRTEEDMMRAIEEEERRELPFEERYKIHNEPYSKHYYAWQKWSKDKMTNHSGICDNWKLVTTF